ncbi:hypothetical protein DFH27DRAFT_352314 [Peziza echinospora]|nr:hypothetical protein DFH27DRAFT_352314 [Peziza echinospora]
MPPAPAPHKTTTSRTTTKTDVRRTLFRSLNRSTAASSSGTSNAANSSTSASTNNNNNNSNTNNNNNANNNNGVPSNSSNNNNNNSLFGNDDRDILIRNEDGSLDVEMQMQMIHMIMSPLSSHHDGVGHGGDGGDLYYIGDQERIAELVKRHQHDMTRKIPELLRQKVQSLQDDEWMFEGEED